MTKESILQRLREVGERLLNLLPFNPAAQKARIGVLLFLVVLCVAFATRCHAAADPYVQLLGGKTIMRGETEVLDLSVTWPRTGPDDSALSLGLTLVGASDRYGRAVRPNSMLRATIVDGFGNLDVSFGVVYLHHDDVFNSCRMNFALGLGYRFQFLPITLAYQHYSNAGTCSPNKGRDMVLIGWRF